MAAKDDDVIPFAAETNLSHPWFEGPAPPVAFTFGLTAVFAVPALYLYLQRAATLRGKFGASFQGSLKACALISAYMDNYGHSRFATLKLCTKSFFFLGLLQLNFHRGFWIMWGILVIESSLDTIRVLLAYWNCKSLGKAQVVSEEETRDLQQGNSAVLDPTNVYEDLTRPKSIAGMVFLVQAMLIGLVMVDTYKTTTRTCFDGTDGCPMLTSLGSYTMYLMGTFMASVFYVGPRNSYGQKEQNPTFWLKLFLMSKQPSVLTWTDSVTDQQQSYELRPNDWRIWLRFILSFLVNGVGFHFLLHVLPIQVAGQSTIIGVVFRAIGMIYLADLDDSAGHKMTLVQVERNQGAFHSFTPDETLGTQDSYGSLAADTELEAAKQKIIDDALQSVKKQLEDLVANGRHEKSAAVAARRRPQRKFFNITNALFVSANQTRQKKNDEKTRLVH